MFSETELDNSSLLELFPEGKYGLGKFVSIKTKAEFTYDSRDNNSFTQSGFYADGSLYYSPEFLDVKKH